MRDTHRPRYMPRQRPKDYACKSMSVSRAWLAARAPWFGRFSFTRGVSQSSRPFTNRWLLMRAREFRARHPFRCVCTADVNWREFLSMFLFTLLILLLPMLYTFWELCTAMRVHQMYWTSPVVLNANGWENVWWRNVFTSEENIRNFVWDVKPLGGNVPPPFWNRV